MNWTDHDTAAVSKTEKSIGGVTKRHPKSVSFKIGLLVSSIALAMISFYLITEFQQSNYAVLSRVTTAVAESKKLILPDGSRVNLKPGSTLRYPKVFSGETREVYLEGEAYFQISPGKESFVVHGHAVNVKTGQATFNYRHYPFQSAVSLQLVNGDLELVSHRDRNRHYTLSEGHRMVFYPETEKWDVRQTEIKQLNNAEYIWVDNAPLSEVVAYLEVRFNFHAKLEHGLESCRVHFEGVVPSAEEFYKMVARSLGLQLIFSDKQLLLKGQACLE